MCTLTYIFLLFTVLSCHNIYGDGVDIIGDLKRRVDYLESTLFRLQDTADKQKSEIEHQKSEIEHQKSEIEHQKSEIEHQKSEIGKQKEINRFQQEEIKSLGHLCNKPDINKNATNKSIRSVEDNNQVAFFAVKSHSETALADHTIVFDKAILNRGSTYNAYTGTFVTPQTGVYFLSWTIYSSAHSYISTRLMVNGKQISVMFSDSEEIHDYHSSTGVAILELNIGESVYIKSHPTQGQTGSIFSTDIGRCTFSGFLIY